MVAAAHDRFTLCRWQKRPDPKSRRPYRPRKPRCTSFEAQRVEKRAAIILCGGNARSRWCSIARALPSPSRQSRGFLPGSLHAAQSSPLPSCAADLQADASATAEQRYARRLPKGRKAKVPGEFVQIDTLFINIRPDEAIKHITTYDPAGPKPVDQALESKHGCLGLNPRKIAPALLDWTIVTTLKSMSA